MFRILRRSGSALGNDNNWAPASPSITPPYRYGPQPPEVIGTYVRVRLCFVTSARVPAGTIARTCIDRRSGAISPRRNAPSPRVIGPVFSKISRARIDTYCTRDRVRRLGYGNYRPPQTAFFFPVCGAGGTARIDGAPPSFTRGLFIGFKSFDVFDRFTEGGRGALNGAIETGT